MSSLTGVPPSVKVHLVDGTYELFRHFYGAPGYLTAAGQEVGATRAVLGSLLGLVESGATHIGVATDHVIESWRNREWPGYKTSAGVPPELLAQFELFEEAVEAFGFPVWAMTELEADDALASAAAVLCGDQRVAQVLVCSPDKDLCQCVVGERVVCLDRRKGQVTDEAAVRERYGIGPGTVPDWLALVGDSSDGYPGLAGWGAKAATAVLSVYGYIEQIPLTGPWEVALPRTRVAALQEGLRQGYELTMLFKRLATCVVERDILPQGSAALDFLFWSGPSEGLEPMCARLEAPKLLARAHALSQARGTTAGEPPPRAAAPGSAPG